MSSAICVQNPALSDELAALRSIEEQGIRVERFKCSAPFASGQWGVSIPLTVWLLRSARRYDIIQVHGSYLFSSFAGALAAKLAGRPLVVIPHESLTEFDIRTNGSTLKRIAKRVIRAWLLWSADAIVFSSALEQRDSIEPRHFAKSTVIYHPVLDEEAPRQQRRSLPKDAGRLLIGFLGRFHPKKNLELLLEAVSQTANVSLRIAGDGSPGYRAQLRGLANRLGIDDRVEWLGFIAAEQSRFFFESIDVLAMPSAYECFGRVAAEAMVHGVPTIVTKTTGVAEIVERSRCGIVILPDVVELRSAIEKLRSDPTLLGELSRQSLEASERELSLRSYGASIARVYRLATI